MFHVGWFINQLEFIMSTAQRLNLYNALRYIGMRSTKAWRIAMAY